MCAYKHYHIGNLSYFQCCAMLPNREVLMRLLKANTSFLIYGQKASGKTYLVHSLFKDSGVRFIQINCALVAKKSNFLQLFNVELNKFLANDGGEVCSRLGAPVNLDSWIREMKQLIFEREDVIERVDNLYVFMDNIEEMSFSDWFMPAFYSACQREFPFRLSFLFCGVNFMRKEYTLDLPFRTMLAFCMPKPTEQTNFIINETIEVFFRQEFGQKCREEEINKAVMLLGQNIRASFDNIEYNLAKMKSNSRAVFDSIKPYLSQTELSKSLMRQINTGKLKECILKIIEHGALPEHEIKRLDANDHEDQHEVNNNLQYYPNLILASIHLADYYPEKEDKRRFQDYKGRTNQRNKDLKRSEFKIGRHPINRIIAISETLESGKANDKEFALEHHSLDYYATFEHLRKIGRIRVYGSKCTGNLKQEEAKAFIAKLDQKYEQFMSNN